MIFLRSRRCLTLFLAAAALSLLAGCSRDTRPNVVVISIDTLRADHCSFMGYERETTPRLDAFAAEGALVSRAYAPTSTTGPTHASLFTSLYPLGHGVIQNGLELDDRFTTLA